MCMPSISIEIRTRLGIGHKMPIAISKRPKKTINWPKSINGIVLLSKSPTSGLAGLTPKTLSMPNQKKTMKSANRPKGKLGLLAHPINSRSKNRITAIY